jgi:hypothetical protein
VRFGLGLEDAPPVVAFRAPEDDGRGGLILDDTDTSLAVRADDKSGLFLDRGWMERLH